jgi:hypothetical protein
VAKVPEPTAEKSTAKANPEPVETTSAPAENQPPAAPPKTRNSKRSSPAKTSEPATERATVSKSEPTAAEPGEQSPAKIVIEMLDGTKFERDMSAVRRVMVESGYIVVTGTDGKVNRIRLASVLRMSIGQ